MSTALEAKKSRDENNHHRLIRLREVLAITGLSRSHVYNLATQGKFPAPLKLSERSSAWILAEVNGWINERIANRDAEVVK